MPSLTQHLEAAMIEQGCLRNTRQTYHHWVKKFYRYVRKRAKEWQPNDVRQWLLHLHDENYSPVSRKQALCAIKFVFDHVFKSELGWLDLPPMPRVRKTLKIIPSREELGRIFAGLKGQCKIMAALMYGAGLRVEECCTLRVQDIDFAALTVRVLNGKGDKTRLTVLPVLLVPALKRHFAWRKSVHDLDLSNGHGFVELPGRLAFKYKNANREFRWQFLFPSALVRGQHRWHTTKEAVEKQMRKAVAAAGILKRVTPHTLRHAFVTHGLEAGNDVKVMRDLCGHQDVNTTMGYNHADRANGISPLDAGPRQTVIVESSFTERLLSC
jgi:site-specific recombinase XerD